MPGVHLVVGGRELAAATDPLLIGVDAPLVKRYPLAVDRARYAGEWVVAVVADSRALAEDAREKIRVDYEPLPFLLDGEAAYAPGSTPVHPDHGSNVLLDKRFVWGDVDERLRRGAAQARLSREVGPQRHRADRDLRRGGELGPLARDAGRVGLDPDAQVRRPDRPRAAHAAQRRARAPGCRRRRQLRRQARHQAHGARGLPLAPAVAPGQADRGPAREHARRRHAWARARVRRRAGLRRRRHGACHAHARARQRRRLRGPLAAAARQAGRRHRRPLPHRRGRLSCHRRDHQQDAAGGGARLRPVAHQLRHRDRHRPRRRGAGPRPAGGAAAQFHPRRASFPT